MTAPVLLRELRRRGITLRIEGDALVYDAPKGTLTPDLADRMRANRELLTRLISNYPPEICAGCNREKVEGEHIAGIGGLAYHGPDCLPPGWALQGEAPHRSLVFSADALALRVGAYLGESRLVAAVASGAQLTCPAEDGALDDWTRVAERAIRTLWRVGERPDEAGGAVAAAAMATLDDIAARCSVGHTKEEADTAATASAPS